LEKKKKANNINKTTEALLAFSKFFV
jgi:hypothetical protein